MSRAPTNAPELLLIMEMKILRGFMAIVKEDSEIKIKDLISIGWLGRERFGEGDTGKLQLAPDVFNVYTQEKSRWVQQVGNQYTELRTPILVYLETLVDKCIPGWDGTCASQSDTGKPDHHYYF